MTTIKIALAAALVAAATTSALAGGLTPADPQFLNLQTGAQKDVYTGPEAKTEGTTTVYNGDSRYQGQRYSQHRPLSYDEQARIIRQEDQQVHGE